MAKTLLELHREFEAGFNSGDVNGLVELYEPNAVLIPETGRIAKGTAEIRTALESLLAARPSIRLDTAATFETADGIALLHGRWTLKAAGPDGPFEVSGTSSEVARRQPDGRWLYLLDNPYGA
jgi:uncharacterized protein (TIGR02246 family)